MYSELNFINELKSGVLSVTNQMAKACMYSLKKISKNIMFISLIIGSSLLPEHGCMQD